MTPEDGKKLVEEIRQYIVKNSSLSLDADAWCSTPGNADAGRNDAGVVAVATIKKESGVSVCLRLTKKHQTLVVEPHLYVANPNIDENNIAIAKRVIALEKTYEKENSSLYDECTQMFGDAGWETDYFYEWENQTATEQGYGALLHYYIPLKWNEWGQCSEGQKKFVVRVVDSILRFLPQPIGLGELMRTGEAQMNDGDDRPMEQMTDKIIKSLKACGQVILHGAPGTGKTYLARKIACELTGDDLDANGKTEHVRVVQFHAGYDYSDFVVGLKPKLVGERGKEQVSFAWKKGTFLRFAEDAKKAYDEAADKSQAQNYVFIIDEINRADLSRVFGELFSLIEKDYRYPKNKLGVLLPGSDENGEQTMVIPENLYIIGTMNDIDRSVESMDFALRRRFAWYEVTAEDSQLILDSKIMDGGVRDKLKKAMGAVNGIIGNPENGLGSDYKIGGAIFANINSCDGEGPNRYKQLWTYYIETILKEYLRGNRNKVELMENIKNAYDGAVG